jgi:hypothetical protein
MEVLFTRIEKMSYDQATQGSSLANNKGIRMLMGYLGMAWQSMQGR